MKTINEITVFSIGDSLELKTWSNVPYFFTKSIEDKHIKVNRINIQENHLLSIIYKYSLFIILKLLYKNSDHSYFRSRLNAYLTNKKIELALKKHSTSDAFIFLTYSFSIKKSSNKKIVLFSDWSYLYRIESFFKRKPYWFEKKALAREENNINEADVVISLFPKSKEFNILKYKNLNQNYLGNVINCNYPHNKNKLITTKTKSNKILFIGNKKYKTGAINLINAFKIVSEKTNPKPELHIIGLLESDLNLKHPNLNYHGYLNKGLENENELYYNLISEAKVIVNTNQDWGAFSAMTEAMYFYTPVITSPYAEFTETYGKEIDFGYYVNHNSETELVEKIEVILKNSNDDQIEMMTKAFEKVKDFTWSNYSEKIIELITK